MFEDDSIQTSISPATSDWNSLALGKTLSNILVRWSPWLARCAWVIGRARSYKTVPLRRPIVSALCRGHHVVVIDFYKSDLFVFNRWLSGYAVTLADASALLGDLLDEVQRRGGVMKRLGVPTWTELSRRDQRKNGFSPITLVFDESLDSLSSAVASYYFISDDIGVAVSAITPGPLFNKVIVKLAHPLKNNVVYSISAKKLSDCAGNEIGMTNNTKVGLASALDNLDIVINEMLFNPKAVGTDYIEIYNRSKKIADLNDIYLANRTSSGSAGSLKQLSISPRLLFPGEYLAITENADIIKQQYFTRDPDAFLELNSLPSYPNDLGTVLLLSGTGKLIDEVSYTEKWHFKLITNYEGVALERIDYNKPSQEAGNWHSASASNGYGTPGYQNSQFMSELMGDATIAVTPAIFSPDNDGFNDFATITYSFPEPGYVCNISFYDINGRAVKYLTRNAICGLTGYFRWDGLDEKNNKLPIGVYVMITEVFNLKGKTKKFKNGIVLARRLY